MDVRMNKIINSMLLKKRGLLKNFLYEDIYIRCIITFLKNRNNIVK